MDNFDRHSHWENIYKTKQANEVGWYQPVPLTSLQFLEQFNIPVTAKIIDVGGGDSFFVDHLLDLGYQDITVLDISETAILRAKERLGDAAGKVKWIVADAADFKPAEKYDFWHDRAAFHFLTRDSEVESYIDTVQQSMNPEGILIIGTFSTNGPKKCSGIDIRQYSEESMVAQLKKYFHKVKCFTIDHITPSGATQNYIFCSFRKMQAA
ncbi:MAG: class I SAM-dependent methyltransferase [Saprospiraceae bacterium]|nr:class I SAM-dependent methyltransferase [Candidatus Opimibacter skivensis]